MNSFMKLACTLPKGNRGCSKRGTSYVRSELYACLSFRLRCKGTKILLIFSLLSIRLTFFYKSSAPFNVSPCVINKCEM